MKKLISLCFILVLFGCYDKSKEHSYRDFILDYSKKLGVIIDDSIKVLDDPKTFDYMAILNKNKEKLEDYNKDIEKYDNIPTDKESYQLLLINNYKKIIEALNLGMNDNYTDSMNILKDVKEVNLKLIDDFEKQKD